MTITVTHTRTFAVVVYANPYNACDVCHRRAAGYYRDRPGPPLNWPCDDRGGFASVCPSWGPVDGCRCIESYGRRDHGVPPMPAGYDDPLDGRNQ